MSESKLIFTSKKPQTYSSLKEMFEKIGIQKGMTLIVHSSMKSLGWVCGGPTVVIQVLQDILSSSGTLIMPTHSTNLSHPQTWTNPPVPSNWLTILQSEMPEFNRFTTPSYFMGIIPELFRTFPNVLRSNHPIYSFAAWGKHAKYIIEDHSLSNGLGVKSPLKKIYDLNGNILLLGVDYDSNTSMHLAEHLSDKKKACLVEYPIRKNNLTIWGKFSDLEYDESQFKKIGLLFEQNHNIVQLNIGTNYIKLINQKKLVDFTVDYFNRANYY